MSLIHPKTIKRPSTPASRHPLAEVTFSEDCEGQLWSEDEQSEEEDQPSPQSSQSSTSTNGIDGSTAVDETVSMPKSPASIPMKSLEVEDVLPLHQKDSLLANASVLADNLDMACLNKDKEKMQMMRGEQMDDRLTTALSVNSSTEQPHSPVAASMSRDICSLSSSSAIDLTSDSSNLNAGPRLSLSSTDCINGSNNEGQKEQAQVHSQHGLSPIESQCHPLDPASPKHPTAVPQPSNNPERSTAAKSLTDGVTPFHSPQTSLDLQPHQVPLSNVEEQVPVNTVGQQKSGKPSSQSPGGSRLQLSRLLRHRSYTNSGGNNGARSPLELSLTRSTYTTSPVSSPTTTQSQPLSDPTTTSSTTCSGTGRNFTASSSASSRSVHDGRRDRKSDKQGGRSERPRSLMLPRLTSDRNDGPSSHGGRNTTPASPSRPQPPRSASCDERNWSVGPPDPVPDYYRHLQVRRDNRRRRSAPLLRSSPPSCTSSSQFLIGGPTPSGAPSIAMVMDGPINTPENRLSSGLTGLGIQPTDQRGVASGAAIEQQTRSSIQLSSISRDGRGSAVGTDSAQPLGEGGEQREHQQQERPERKLLRRSMSALSLQSNLSSMWGKILTTVTSVIPPTHPTSMNGEVDGGNSHDVEHGHDDDEEEEDIGHEPLSRHTAETEVPEVEDDDVFAYPQNARVRDDIAADQANQALEDEEEMLASPSSATRPIISFERTLPSRASTDGFVIVERPTATTSTVTSISTSPQGIPIVKPIRPLTLANLNLSNPPSYWEAVIKYRGFPKIQPRPEEGNEVLPRYSCSVFREGCINRKTELIGSWRPYRRPWKRTFAHLRGTSLRLYAVDEDDVPRVHIRNISLQLARCELATDYKQRQHVIRIRSTDRTMLMECKDRVDALTWLEHLQAAANIATPLEERCMPKFYTLSRPGSHGNAGSSRSNTQRQDQQQQQQQQQQHQQQHQQQARHHRQGTSGASASSQSHQQAANIPHPEANEHPPRQAHQRSRTTTSTPRCPSSPSYSPSSSNTSKRRETRTDSHGHCSSDQRHRHEDDQETLSERRRVASANDVPSTSSSARHGASGGIRSLLLRRVGHSNTATSASSTSTAERSEDGPSSTMATPRPSSDQQNQHQPHGRREHHTVTTLADLARVAAVTEGNAQSSTSTEPTTAEQYGNTMDDEQVLRAFLQSIGHDDDDCITSRSRSRTLDLSRDRRGENQNQNQAEGDEDDDDDELDENLLDDDDIDIEELVELHRRRIRRRERRERERRRAAEMLLRSEYGSDGAAAESSSSWRRHSVDLIRRHVGAGESAVPAHLGVCSSPSSSVRSSWNRPLRVLHQLLGQSSPATTASNIAAAGQSS
ncbi:hypothetical protein BGW42_004812 [Actinomortierella wolfii]|nr:hypothetical protein BGW42_004812 [Actinomortierella wolfii]